MISTEKNEKKEGNRIMRDPNRIPEVLKELEDFWKQVPDWRLGQVISNFSYELTGVSDPFYLEDKDILELLKQRNEILKQRNEKK